MRILVVEDDALVASGIKEGLSLARFTVDLVGRAEPAVEQIRTGEVFDLAIVDLGLPGMGGLSLIRQLRQSGVQLPILILTARDSLEDCVQGLEVGADDYMTKPFSPRELVLRLQSVLRRRHALMKTLVAGDLVVDPMALKVTLKGSFLDLSLIEFKLLSVLMSRAGDILSREELLSEVWGHGSNITKRAVDTNIYRLREKLKDHGSMMKTVRGIGYLFAAVPQRTAFAGDL